MVLSNAFPLMELPEELISEILSYLPREDRLWSCIVCKRFLKILFGFNNGVFELFMSQTKLEKHLKQILECKDISGIITHFIVTYPYESVTDCIEKITSSEVKGND